MNKIETFNPSTRFNVPDDVFNSKVNGEIVILSLKSGSYFGLDHIGTIIWNEIVQSKTFAEIRSFLLTKYEVSEEECDRDLQELLQELTAAHLVEVVDEQTNQTI